MSEYTTRQGDRIDIICRAYYGSERGGTTETVLASNPRLAEYRGRLPAGLVIDLPTIAAPATTEKIIRLWD